MPKKSAISTNELAKPARFAPLFIDFIFKRVFAAEHGKSRLISLIETFLGEFLQAKITDVVLLPNEQINKTRKQRAAVFDLHCMDNNGNRFIVEMQLAKRDYFIGKLLVYISQTITGLAKKGKAYKFDLPIVYSLSFLNYELEPEDKHGDITQHIGLSNLKHAKKRYPHIHIALVMLTRFKKTLEQCKTTRDLWLYLFRNLHKLDKIPPEFNNKLFRPVFEIAEICNFNEVELRDYEANMKYLDDYNATIEYAKKEAKREGMEKGVVIGKKEGFIDGILQTAKNMLNEGLKPRTVARYTKLPLEQIMALR